VNATDENDGGVTSTVGIANASVNETASNDASTQELGSKRIPLDA
jgi:hypothetical protein